MIERIRSRLEEKPCDRFSNGVFSKLPKAAVSLILKPDVPGNQVVMLLLKRSISETDPWSGQMAFPGGRWRESDGEIINTAYRELAEETGIGKSRLDPLGRLDDLVPGNRSLSVTPFVFLVTEPTDVKVNAREISDNVWIPINFFKDKSNSSLLQVQIRGTRGKVPSFAYQGAYVIWGMTLRIIDDFLSRIL
jgi:8-oxo-dGTP pyrophosphatase MutT (NUDIX family)